MRRVTVGIALGPERIATATWSRPLAAWVHPGVAEWDDLRLALTELKDRFKPRPCRALIALLPPLAHARLLELPRLSSVEYRRILSRDAARYFPTGAGEQVAAGEVSRNGASPVRVFAAVASSSLLDGVCRAAQSAGWKVASIVPAEAAWLAGADGARAALVIPLETMLEVLSVEGGAPVSVRRLPAAPGAAERLVTELSQQAGTSARLLDDPFVAAAASVTSARGPELLPEGAYAARRRRTTRITLRLATAALVLLVVAAAVDFWGARRELAAVAARRATIHEAVAAALARQDTLEELLAGHAALERADRAAIRWSEVLADFSDYLPRDAYLSVFRGRGDSVGLEGVAQRAAGVFTALQRAPRVARIRADAPIRQEAGRPGMPPIEKFAISARLAGDAARSSERR